MAGAHGRVGLPDDLAVVVEPERPQVLEVGLDEFVPARHGIEVLHPDEEPPIVHPCEEPRQQCGPQVADVEPTRGTGSEATVGHAVTLTATLPTLDGDVDVHPNLGRKDRLAVILERDGSHCVWCRRGVDIDLVRATTEHVVPKLKGGPSWIENEVAACARCNRQRGHATPAAWLDECEGRGWTPDAAAVVQALERLAAAIEERGGQRRARRYVESQLRRLNKR